MLLGQNSSLRWIGRFGRRAAQRYLRSGKPITLRSWGEYYRMRKDGSVWVYGIAGDEPCTPRKTADNTREFWSRRTLYPWHGDFCLIRSRKEAETRKRGKWRDVCK